MAAVATILAAPASQDQEKSGASIWFWLWFRSDIYYDGICGLLIPMFSCYLLFWNQVLTWVSLRPSLLARLPRSSTLQLDQDQFPLGPFFIGRHTHDQKVINTDINISKYGASVFHIQQNHG